MGTLYLVRHGQASFGADDYDNLCDMGERQCRRLGEYFAFKGIRFDAAIRGTLRRHAQSFEAIRAGVEQPSLDAHLWPGLNEYDGEAVIAAIHPEPLGRADTPEKYRHHFRVLRDGLTQWMNGVVSPRGMPSYVDFAAGVAGALEHVRKTWTGNVLMVSSGGPISTAVGQILGTTPETTIELNLHIRNSAVTEFRFTPKRHNLITFNTLPHLDAAEYAEWITHA